MFSSIPWLNTVIRLALACLIVGGVMGGVYLLACLMFRD